MVSVKDVIGMYDVLVVHGFLGKEAGPLMPKEFTFPGRNLDWHEKLEALMTNAPPISASTIQDGDTYPNYWSPIGVILNNGVIEFASPRDMSSTVGENNKRLPMGLCLPVEFRDTVSDYYFSKPVEEQIERAIKGRWSKYNELIVRDPKIAGFYILPEICRTNRKDIGNVEVADISKRLTDLDMPFYAIRRGKVYEARYNPQSNWIDFFDKPVTRRELMDKEYELPAVNKGNVAGVQIAA